MFLERSAGRNPRRFRSDGVRKVAKKLRRDEAAAATARGQALRTTDIQVTRLSRGVPVGSELEYVDLGTIAHALVDRRSAAN